MFGSASTWDALDAQAFHKILGVNTIGVFQMVRACAPHLKEAKGAIVNVSSIAGALGIGSSVPYIASKGAVIALTRSIAREVGDAGIRCNCLAPGLTMSANVQANAAWAGDIVRNNIASRCIKREAVPEDLVGALLFLASADSDFMSGQTVVVDGGSVTH